VTGDSANLDHGITVTGNIVGSPSYMSPEQMKNSSGVDRRTDIWSLGVVLYECVTGKLPFPGETYAEICLKAHQDPPLSPQAHGVTVPPALEALIMKCLAKEPEQRFATAAALGEALLPFAPVPARTSIGSLSSTPPPETRRSSLIGRLGRLRGPAVVTSTLPSWAHTPPPPGGRRRWPALLLAGSGFSALALLFVSLGDAPEPSSQAANAPSAPARESAPPPTRAAAARETPVVAPLGPIPQPLSPPSSSPSAAPAATPEMPVKNRAPASATSASTVTVIEKPRVPSTALARPRKPASERDSKSSVWSR
jgi:serine/threonine-protein kinase